MRRTISVCCAWVVICGLFGCIHSKPIARLGRDCEHKEKKRIISKQRAVQAPYGRFILLQRAGPSVALRIVEHTKPGPDGENYGARYECHVFHAAGAPPTRLVGEVFEPQGGGVANHVHIDCGSFRIEWSRGDWIYYGDSVTAMAKTEATDINEIDFSDPGLVWYYRPDS